MKDNFLLNQLAQAVVDSSNHLAYDMSPMCYHCGDYYKFLSEKEPHKPHCIVLVAEQILKGNEDE